MLKIDIISGFLGAGKTTFIKRLLETELKNEKVVLIENEYGEVSVDSDLLSDSNIEIKELSQGCICCSLVGDFSKSLNEVIAKFNPDRILIEPSGVGKLSDIVGAVVKADLKDYINSLVCLVDAKKAKVYHKNFGEFFIDQIKTAHTVILSRTDIADNTKVNEAFQIVRELNPNAVIVTTPIAELDDKELLKAYEGFDTALLNDIDLDLDDDDECDDPNCSCHHHHHHDDDDDDEDEEEHEHHHHHHHDHEHEECDDPECSCHHHHDEEGHEHHHHHHHHGHDADEVFNSVGIETAKKYDVNELKNTLDKMANGEFGMIVRAKGIIHGNDNKWYQFNLTPEEVEVLPNKAIPMGKIVVIGSHIDEDSIKKLF
jgi:G3E family GTPase